MTSEWMAGAQMSEWANQSLPRARERDGAGTPALEQAKRAFEQLGAEERRQFLLWLSEKAQSAP